MAFYPAPKKPRRPRRKKIILAGAAALLLSLIPAFETRAYFVSVLLIAAILIGEIYLLSRKRN